MPYPTTSSTTELQAINQILAAVGQAPVTTLERTNPDVAISYDALQQVSREVQSEGWAFNREYSYPFTPNQNDEIEYPKNVLQLDVTTDPKYFNNKYYDTVKREGKLYDRRGHSYKFTETLYCDVQWLFDWDDLPIPIQLYIIAKASVKASLQMIGDPEQFELLAANEAYMRSIAIEYETQQGDYNYLYSPEYKNNYITYRPMQTLQRY